MFKLPVYVTKVVNKYDLIGFSFGWIEDRDHHFESFGFKSTPIVTIRSTYFLDIRLSIS